jgi:hypothetical protein
MLFPIELSRPLLQYWLKSGVPFYATQSPDTEINKISLVAEYVLLTFPRKATLMSMDST